MVRLVGPGNVHTEILRLLLVQLGQAHAERIKVQARHLLVELLGQRVDADLVVVDAS